MLRGIQNALVAVSSHMKPIEEKIRKSLKSSTYLKLDETPIQIYNKRGYVWVCVGDDDVSITVATTRGAIVLWEYYPHWNIPITCDGYAAYNEFHIRQRCWAHILREADDLAQNNPDCKLLHEKLQKSFHDAKCAVLNIDTQPMIITVQSIAQRYTDLGYGFGTKLSNASSDLFTFVNHLGMEPTNNESERMLRKVVIHRKIRQRIVSVGGMRMFGILMSCMMTWRKQNLNITDKLLDVLGAT